MIRFLYTREGVLSAGQYLIGNPRWGDGVDLRSALLVARAGGAGITELGLEVSGIVRTRVVVTASAAGFVRMAWPLTEAVPAGSVVRWICLSAPDEANRLREVGLTLTGTVSATGVVVTPTDLHVDWVDAGTSGASEEVRLYDYNGTTKAWTAASAGVTTDRAVISGGSGFSVTFVDEASPVIALQTLNGSLQANQIFCNGGTGVSSSPRLHFMVGNQRVASLTRNGEFRVVDASEIAGPLTGGADRFEFYESGVLTAVLAGGTLPILTALLMREPIE